MSDRSSPSLSQFLERWHRFSVAVKELHPYVDVIRQVEGILEEDDSSKAELEQSKKQIADLEYAKREMKGIFAQRILAQQKEHDSDLSKIKAQAKKAEERANLHCARLRESDQQLLGLKEELDSQCEKLSAKIHEHDHIYFVLGIVGLDDSL
jgi:chromosome segregation ATPase